MVDPRGTVYEFGDFRLDAGRQRLLRDGQIVALTPRAFETLKVLIEHRGALVEREVLLGAVWRDVVVEDGNLTVTISMIRKALGDDPNDRRFIETVPRLGYKFVAEVRMPGGVAEEIDGTASSVVLPPDAAPAGARERRVQPGWAMWTAAVLILAAGLAYSRPWVTAEPAGTPDIDSIAVRPLTPLSGVAEDKALGLGFADALITSLAGAGGVRVRSAQSVNGEDVDRAPADLGRALGVDAVLDGTFQRANGILRVTLRLIRTGDGSQVWSDSFDERETEIFKLQDRMAAQTAQSLSWNLTAGGKPRRAYTSNREAYHAYLMGRLFFDRRQAKDYEKAIAEFERAIALDSEYAVAFAGLADVYALQAGVQKGARRDTLYEKSKAMATRALELDESLAEAHTSLGWVKRVRDWDWTGSEAEFKRALELNPSDVNARQWYALLLTTLGRTDEALTHAAAARDLEPLSSVVLQNYFTILQYRRETSALPVLAEQIAQVAESRWTAIRVRALAYARSGNFAKVIEISEAYQSESAGQPVPDTLLAHLAIAYSHTGRHATAKSITEQLGRAAKTDSHAAYLLASVYAEQGRRDDAIALLQQCLAAHDDRMVWIKVEPRFDSLRNDARFRALLRAMGL